MYLQDPSYFISSSHTRCLKTEIVPDHKQRKSLYSYQKGNVFNLFFFKNVWNIQIICDNLVKMLALIGIYLDYSQFISVHYSLFHLFGAND